MPGSASLWASSAFPRRLVTLSIFAAACFSPLSNRSSDVWLADPPQPTGRLLRQRPPCCEGRFWFGAVPPTYCSFWCQVRKIIAKTGEGAYRLGFLLGVLWFQVLHSLSHFELIFVHGVRCMLSCFTVSNCDPMACSPPGFSVHGILQARILQWVAMSSSREPSRLRGQTHVSYVSCIGRQVLHH